MRAPYHAGVPVSCRSRIHRFIQITITPQAESYCIGAPEGPG
jgi:hypothetical protein